MSFPTAFHETRFPTAISFGSSGGPERLTEIVTLGSGHEERNSRWADSRHRYDAGYGVRSLDDLHVIVDFFEERRAKLYGFRWRDFTDWKSCPPSATPNAIDQNIGTGDGIATSFQLIKTYGGADAPYERRIHKPVAGSVNVSVDGILQIVGTDYSLNEATGLVSFQPSAIPSPGASVGAGFEFDVPVRFDTDNLAINLTAFSAGDIPSIPLVEIRL
ncbi:MAG: TIGR02217 family protein [Hyphomicrobiales bacterium]